MTAAGASRPLARASAERAAGDRGAACDCRYCGGLLPRDRTATFCPSCGQNLTVRQCPACSAELDVGWRFCVCCGRGIDGAPAATPVATPAAPPLRALG